MRILVPILSAFFSGLKILAVVLASPVTLACTVGLMIFTYKIIRDLEDEKPRAQEPPDFGAQPPLFLTELRA